MYASDFVCAFWIICWRCGSASSGSSTKVTFSFGCLVPAVDHLLDDAGAVLGGRERDRATAREAVRAVSARASRLGTPAPACGQDGRSRAHHAGSEQQVPHVDLLCAAPGGRPPPRCSETKQRGARQSTDTRKLLNISYASSRHSRSLPCKRRRPGGRRLHFRWVLPPLTPLTARDRGAAPHHQFGLEQELLVAVVLAGDPARQQ